MSFVFFLCDRESVENVVVTLWFAAGLSLLDFVFEVVGRLDDDAEYCLASGVGLSVSTIGEIVVKATSLTVDAPFEGDSSGMCDMPMVVASVEAGVIVEPCKGESD